MSDQPREPRGLPTGGRFPGKDRARPGLRLVGLQPYDLTRVMEQFGVSEAQVRRDHAISLILAAPGQSSTTL